MSMAQPGVVAPWRAAYVPGDWYAIAGPTSLVVLEPGPGRTDMIGDLWADVVASASMSDLVDRLAGYGITELPDLAVVFWSSAGMRTLVRGGVRLVDPVSGAQVASGNGVVTWNEVGLEKVTRVRIGVGDQAAEGESLPLAVGVVRAGAVLLSADAHAAVRSPQPLLRSAGAVARGAAVTSGRADSTGGEAAPRSDSAAQHAEQIEPGQGASGERAVGAGLAESGESANDSDRARSAAVDQEQRTEHPRPDERPVAPMPGASAGDTGPDFPPVGAGDDGEPETGESPVFGMDSPWGPQAGAAAGAGVVGGAVAGAAGSARAAGAAGVTGVGAGAAGAAGAVGAAGGGAGAAGASQFRGGVSSPDSPSAAAIVGSGGAVAPAGTSTPAEFSLEQFEMENDDTQLISNPAPIGPEGPMARPGGPAPTELLVEAVRCPNGHANAPGSTVCRVCRSPIPARPPELIPKPLLARLRTADGTVVDLDRALLLGRAPSEERSTVPLPRLVTLASPAQDISRTHLQVVADDWQVLVTDLNSTNGTFVTDPGPAGNRGLLPPGQPTPVPIGAVLELGEGVTLTIEPAD